MIEMLIAAMVILVSLLAMAYRVSHRQPRKEKHAH